MIRVGMVIGQLANGGAERQLYETCRGLKGTQIAPVVYCLSETTEPFGSLLMEMEIPVRHFSRASHFDLRKGWSLRRQVMKDRIDILHSWLIDDNPYAFMATRFTSIHLVTSLRSRPVNRDSFRRWVDRLVFRNSDRVIANSAEVKDFLLDRYRLMEDGIAVVENGIDPDRLRSRRTVHEVRAELTTSSDAFVYVFVGRLSKVKGLRLLIDAFEKVCESRSDAVLWLVGDGPEKEALENQVDVLGVRSQVRFLGVRDDVADLYRAADLLVLCSESEGLPNVVLESLICGTPVLISAESGCQGIVEEGVNGWICETMTIQGFSHCMNRAALALNETPNLGLEQQEPLRDRFGIQRMLTKFDGLYRSLARKRQ